MWRAWKLAAAVVALVGPSGCGVPMIYSGSTPETVASDDGLLGEWRATEPVEIRATVFPGSDSSESPAGSYAVSLTVYDRHEFKTALGLELLVTEIEGVRFADLFLGKTERDRLVGTHGYLAVPVHQVMRMTRQGDVLTVWPLVGKFPDDHTPGRPVAHEAAVVGGSRVPLVTGSSESIRAMLGDIAKDDSAFDRPIVLRRVRTGP
ncbi:MAG: hypothetical protein L6Q35_05505 [Phycisphaerales bacterium]|nr:hypothetical protein [Phycisphaerales bacterium]